jgi:hypothetical protein
MKPNLTEDVRLAGVFVRLVYQWCQERCLSNYRCGGRGRVGRVLIDPANIDPFMQSLKARLRPRSTVGR